VTTARRLASAACDHRRVAGTELRNPFKSEQDAFRILVVIVAVAAIVIACAVLISTTLAAILGVLAVAIGLWRAGGWLGQMLGPPDDEDGAGGDPDVRP
jgi:small-conductance mechanosensitive channel